MPDTWATSAQPPPSAEDGPAWRRRHSAKTALAALATAGVADGIGLSLFNDLPGSVRPVVIVLTAALFLAIPGIPIILVLRHWNDKPDPLASLITPPARTPLRVACRIIGRIIRVAVMLGALTLTFIGVPTEVNAAGYLAGAGQTMTFVPLVDSKVYCDRNGCSSHTTGYLKATGQPADWPNIVPVGKPFLVRTRIWDGPVTDLIGGTGYAITRILLWLMVTLLDLLGITQGAVIFMRAKSAKALSRGRRTGSVTGSATWRENALISARHLEGDGSRVA